MKRGSKHTKEFLKLLLISSVAVSLTTASARTQTDERVLAKIGDRVITVRDFKERSEFTVRPGNFKNKYVTLNNLILEKILAIEAEQTNESPSKPVWQATLKGIKEQKMRAQLYYEAAFNKVKVNPAELKNTYALSTREYELEFYDIPTRKLAGRVKALVDATPVPTDEMYTEVEGMVGKKGVHKAKFDDDDDDAIHEALFTKSLAPGTLVGPVRLSDGTYILMKVLRWTDYPLISSEDQQVRWNKVRGIIHQRKAQKKWRSYQAGLMKGRRLVFNYSTFKVLSAWAMEKYLLDKKNDSLHIHTAEIALKIPEVDFGTPFFTIDNKVWTIEDFRKELMSHPLVYRTTALDSSNFQEQFKLAVVDLIRDHYITQDAYKKSLHKDEEVKRTEDIWRDSFLATDEKKHIVDNGLMLGVINNSDLSNRGTFWDSTMVVLQKKYGTSIKLDFQKLDSLSLSNIDMVALRPGFPYIIEMPQFPSLIVSDNLDYAKH